jgi:hypothetical protein
MHAIEPGDYGRDFVMEVLRTGIMLTDLVANLIEAMPEDAYPEESSAEVVVDMLVGTLRPVTEAAGDRSVRSAIALLTAVQDRTGVDLKRTLALAERLEREERGEHNGGRRH